MGRKPLIDEHTSEKMQSYLMAGVSLKDACALLGIGYTTWNDYERKNPDIRRKRKQWQGMLKARAKMNIAEHVFGNKKKGIEPSVQMSMYFLEREEQKEAKNAQNAVYRANAVKLRAEAKRIEAETAQINGEAGALKESTTIIDDIGAIENAKNKDVKDD